MHNNPPDIDDALLRPQIFDRLIRQLILPTLVSIFYLSSKSAIEKPNTHAHACDEDVTTMELTLLDMERALDDVGVYEDSTHQLLPRHEASGQ